MSPLRPILTGLLLLGALAALPACITEPKPRELVGSGMDMFAPSTMRLHPLTRMAPATGQLEARIELTDQMGDTTKGVGSLSFELFHYELASFDHKGPRVASWTADISTPLANKQQWDPITRTYLFKLRVDDPALLAHGRRYLLIATMSFPNNTTLRDDIKLLVRPPTTQPEDLSPESPNPQTLPASPAATLPAPAAPR